MNRFEPSHPEFSDNDGPHQGPRDPGDRDPDKKGSPGKTGAALREQWLGYLLGALDPAEVVEVERALQANPELKSDLAAIERSLRVLGYPDREDEISHEETPIGLANRTLDFVDAHADVMREIESDSEFVVPASRAKVDAASESRNHTPVELPATRSSIRRWFSSSRPEVAADQRSYTWIDMAVVASLITTAVVLILPAISASRAASQRLACQNNLRNLGLQLQEFAEISPNHAVPRVATSGPRGAAGVYAVALKDRELLRNDRTVICPTSNLAEFTSRFEIPSFAELDAATPESLPRIQRTMGGSYGYNLGYLVEGEGLRAPRMQSRSQYPLMSDAPRPIDWRGTLVSSGPQHGRSGDNILFEDGRVQAVSGSNALPWPDHPFINRSGLVAAGEDAEDVVIAESSARAIPAILKSLPVPPTK